MLRRLFLLLPNTEKAEEIVGELDAKGIGVRHIHALGEDVRNSTLPEATERQRNDTSFRRERIVWGVNLLIFVVSLLAFLVTLGIGEILWSSMSLVVVLLTFIAADQFAVKVPSVQLTEFTNALQQGEVLLMVDVQSYKVLEIEDFVHFRHPEVTIGGVGWITDSMDI